MLKIFYQLNNIYYMGKKIFKDGLGWGFLLWLVGYLLGILLFMVAPQTLLGWLIMPVGTILTLWVLLKKVKASSLRDYLSISIIWTLLAIVLDYFFLVRVFKPQDGYYKLDVYLYYTLTFSLPLVIGWYSKTYKRD
jgi:hypothetical protein